MRVIVLGLGISGKAAVAFLRKRGDKVLGVDKSRPQLDGVEVVSDSTFPDMRGVDLLVKSPGIPHSHPWVEAASKQGIPVIGEIDLGVEELAKLKKRVLAVTGSNGKTTTSLLSAHLLQTAGIKAIAAGNVGIPLIAQVESDYDAFVVELSSFQLEKIVERPVFDGALILNITPNHLDRHPTFEDYMQAKLRVSRCLKRGSPLWLTEQAFGVCGKQIEGVIIKKVETIFSLGYRIGIKAFYPHDLENAAAAYALTGVSRDVLQKGMETFVRPPHRLEWVREVAGVAYINDSKATSVDAVIKAVQALDKKVVLIAGGVDKGGAFSDWLPCFRGKVKCVLALGEAAERIGLEIGREIEVHKISSLAEGIRTAAKQAHKGEAVLLSPGCSSYDQFRDYQHRGDTFRQLVMETL